jgi:hypothetical protein
MSRLVGLTTAPAALHTGSAALLAQLARTKFDPPNTWADASPAGCTKPMNTAASIAITAVTHLALFGPGLLVSIIACVPPKVEVSRNESVE